MSLAINVDKVQAVLLSDGWHEVAGLRGDPTISSFDLDAYEFVRERDHKPDDPLVLHAGGRAGICATGFYFEEPQYNASGREVSRLPISGPLTAVLAVREGRV